MVFKPRPTLYTAQCMSTEKLDYNDGIIGVTFTLDQTRKRRTTCYDK